MESIEPVAPSDEQVNDAVRAYVAAGKRGLGLMDAMRCAIAEVLPRNTRAEPSLDAAPARRPAADPFGSFTFDLLDPAPQAASALRALQELVEAKDRFTRVAHEYEPSHALHITAKQRYDAAWENARKVIS